MSVNVLIISHHDIGNALVQTVKTTFGREELPLPTFAIGILPDTDPQEIIPQLKLMLLQLDQGDGVLILTDLFGATPTNIAQEIQNERIRVVTGLNLPMLLRVMNFAQLSLKELAECAYKGGQAGIIECDKVE